VSFDPVRTAAHIARAHATAAKYENLPDALAPPTIADAYRAQEALVALWTSIRGPVAGLKIATTTKVMQQLMGIDHPCGGLIYANTIHQSPARIRMADFQHLVMECELAVRLGQDLPPRSTPYSRGDVRSAVAAVMPAFELIEDRFADYKSCKPTSLIADNAWNGGIVVGAEVALPAALELDKLAGTLTINGRAAHSGKTDDPLGALAWVANLAIERGRPMTRGMVVITGSVIATLPIAIGDSFSFALDGLGAVDMTAA
jgi:2-keto-4-pentenoate hydratase